MCFRSRVCAHVCVCARVCVRMCVLMCCGRGPNWRTGPLVCAFVRRCVRMCVCACVHMCVSMCCGRGPDWRTGPLVCAFVRGCVNTGVYSLCIGLARTLYIYGVYTVYLTGKSQKKRSYTVYIYGAGQPYMCSGYCMQGHKYGLSYAGVSIQVFIVCAVGTVRRATGMGFLLRVCQFRCLLYVQWVLYAGPQVWAFVHGCVNTGVFCSCNGYYMQGHKYGLLFAGVSMCQYRCRFFVQRVLTQGHVSSSKKGCPSQGQQFSHTHTHTRTHTYTHTHTWPNVDDDRLLGGIRGCRAEAGAIACCPCLPPCKPCF